MAETMTFELVSPERRLAAVQARMAQIPGMEGDFTAMPDHAPLVSTLRPGVLRVEGPEGVQEFFVTGGFAEVAQSGASVLAEEAVERDQLDAAWLDARIETAQALADAAQGEAGVLARQRLMDLQQARDALV